MPTLAVQTLFPLLLKSKVPRLILAPTPLGRMFLPLSSSSIGTTFSSSGNALALSISSAGNALGSSSMSILDFFANSPPPKEGTKNFQSYIGELLEQQIIGDSELIRFIEHLEKGELINPISQEEALTSTPLLVQRRGLQRYLDESSLNQKELLDWSKTTLEKKSPCSSEARGDSGGNSGYRNYQKLEFHPVKRPVRFEMNIETKKAKKVKNTRSMSL